MKVLVLLLAGLAACGASSEAHASDDAFELWFNPSVALDLDDDTSFELETAQRFRSAADDRPDTYFARLWLNQDLSKAFAVGGALERRVNNGSADETRTMQQLSLRSGVLRGRLRLEQRFVDDADRMGLRLRPRLGVAVPLDGPGKWSLESNAELFLTLRSTSRGGSDGLTGLRTQVAVGYEISEKLKLSAGYLRQQDIDRNGPDTVGHAPILGLEFVF